MQDWVGSKGKYIEDQIIRDILVYSSKIGFITLGLCLILVIWTERTMSKLVLNVKYLLLLSFLTAAEFYNLRHIQ